MWLPGRGGGEEPSRQREEHRAQRWGKRGCAAQGSAHRLDSVPHLNQGIKPPPGAVLRIKESVHRRPEESTRHTASKAQKVALLLVLLFLSTGDGDI